MIHIMYEFIYFLQLSCIFFAEAASAHEPRGRAKPELTSCPDQAAPDLCRSDPIHISLLVRVDIEAPFLVPLKY